MSRAKKGSPRQESPTQQLARRLCAVSPILGVQGQRCVARWLREALAGTELALIPIARLER